MTDKAQGISRIVAMDEDSAREMNWEGPAPRAAFIPQIAPVERDNGNRTPGLFRVAYFERGYTTAYYTSHVDPTQANIKFTDHHPTNCGATK
jgi:hypothetical protein